MKYKLLFIASFFFLQFCIAQDKPIAIHYVKLDILKVASQLHFSYEQFNGKRRALEAGAAVHYPSRAFSDLFGNRYMSFQTRGYELDLKYKFYLGRRTLAMYFAPEIKYNYEQWRNAEYLESGPAASSFASWNHITGYANVYSLLAVYGFTPTFGLNVNVDVNIGLGGAYTEMNREVIPERYSTRLRSGHYYEYSPTAVLCLNIGYGFKGK
jgi:hypothetical protein